MTVPLKILSNDFNPVKSRLRHMTLIEVTNEIINKVNITSTTKNVNPCDRMISGKPAWQDCLFGRHFPFRFIFSTSFLFMLEILKVCQIHESDLHRGGPHRVSCSSYLTDIRFWLAASDCLKLYLRNIKIILTNSKIK